MRTQSKLMLICLLPFKLYGAAEQVDIAAMRPPEDIRRVLNFHARQISQLLSTWNEYVYSPESDVARVEVFPWLPNYMLKFGIERVANAQRLKKFIQENELHLIRVPQKYLYHVPGMPLEHSSRNYIVVAELIADDEDDGCVIDHDRMQQLCAVAQGAPHYDLHSGNFLPLRDGVVIIDTDDLAMPSPEEVAKRKQHWLVHGVAMYYDHLPEDEDGPATYNHPLGTLLNDLYTSVFYMSGARKYLTQKIEEEEERRKQLRAPQERKRKRRKCNAY